MALKAKDTPHLRLRIEPSLLGRLQKSADKNERTLTGEIVDRLAESYKREDVQALIEETAQRVSEKFIAAAWWAGASAEASATTSKLTGSNLTDNELSEMRTFSGTTGQLTEDEVFQVQLKRLADLFPNTPIEHHERGLRQFHALRRRGRDRG
jgi:hypothetical protein